MLSAKDFTGIFKTWSRILDLQTEGLSREDLFFQPQPGGNCIYWTLAHIMDNMGSLAKIVEMPLPEFWKKYENYGHGSEPVLADAAHLPSMQELRADYQAMEDLLTEALLSKDEAFFAEVTEKGSRAARLNFYAFHQAYHLGQLETLRNLTGHNEKLI